MRLWIAAAALVAAIGSGGTAQAQTAIEGRVDRLEREMRAVQRKVFPGGAGQMVEPQIRAPEPQPDIPGIPASSPVADLTARVAAAESQLAAMTGQVEQLQYRQRQIEEAFNAFKASTNARLAVLEAGASSVGAAPGAEPAPAPVRATTPAGKPPAAPAKPTTAEAKPVASPERDRAVAAIERPSSSDPAEDGYLYGYRLWVAKFYPEARKALGEVVTKYPKHRRASYAQNLIGRAYLDAGDTPRAAYAFYENYRKNPSGERAPDSLYYLSQALEKLKKPAAEVCKVYGELDQLYADKLSAEMKAGVAEGRARNKCK